jgi:DNA-binding NtrC family response regulator
MLADRSATREPPLIAIADSDASARRVLAEYLRGAGCAVEVFATGAALLASEPARFACVCLDVALDDTPGLEVIAALHARDPDLPILVVTALRQTEAAVLSMRAGAYDYLVKPVDRERLAQGLHRALERRRLASRVRRLERELVGRSPAPSFLGESAAARELARQIERVRASDVAVCIFGESGAGKELVARALHEGSPRARGPFIAINCASIPEALQESELFGHERGSFSGATAQRRGRFEQAAGGTLFLDELGEMSPSTQASLLRTLQERTIRRVGGAEEIPVDARIVAATHRDLEAEVALGRFRADLYFRLVVYPIRVPPLRERKDDLPLLVAHILERLRADVGGAAPRVSRDAIDALARHSWPGNVRELFNVLHRAVLACDGDELTEQHVHGALDLSRALARGPAWGGRAHAGGAIDEAREALTGAHVAPMRELERDAIERALAASGGHVGRAAKLLGIGRATLYRRLAGESPREGRQPSR